MTTTQTTTAAAADGIVKRGSNRIYVDPRMVGRREGWNVRLDFGDVAGLARDILDEYRKDPASGGLLNDIRVERVTEPRADGRVFTLVDGDRRLTAIELLMDKGIDGSGPIVFEQGVPAKIEGKGASELEKLLRMYKANGGKSFLPVEEAEAFRRMKQGGMTIADIEKATGKSDNYIVGSLALLDADGSLIDAVKSGAISGGVAKAIAVNARGDKTKQAEIVADAKAAGKDKVKRRAVLKKIDEARRAKAAKKGKTLKMRALDDGDLSKLGERVERMLKAKSVEAGWLEAGAEFTAKTMDQFLADIGKDPALVAAATLGMLQALKAAAGLKVTLDI